ncbi:hypothetical protein [Aestuariivivens marinum]|uniref:hypothetical protein n=1 Tax=Aestuariivivens marinum TaxID=2913555 RepID=UPI001F565BD5|nr:hypothetical protein [Aestuariivivens marinum]
MRKNLIYMFLGLILFNCSGGSNEEVREVVRPKKPTAASLVFPEQNSECTEGTNVTSSESTITFEWNAGNDTDSYVLTLKNLLSGVTTTHNTNNTEISLTLLRATPYSWFVTSKSNSVSDTAASATWKFYNAGEGLVSYAPFPAVAVSPTNGESIAATTTVTLEWSGSDVDNDIAHYDVYFGEGETLSLLADDETGTNVSNVSVESGKKYKWYVVTTDDLGNTSNSEQFTFNVE